MKNDEYDTDILEENICDSKNCQKYKKRKGESNMWKNWLAWRLATRAHPPIKNKGSLQILSPFLRTVKSDYSGSQINEKKGCIHSSPYKASLKMKKKSSESTKAISTSSFEK